MNKVWFVTSFQVRLKLFSSWFLLSLSIASESSQVFTALLHSHRDSRIRQFRSLQKPKNQQFIPRRSLDRCLLLDPLVFGLPLSFWANPQPYWCLFLRVVLGLQLQANYFLNDVSVLSVPSSSEDFTHWLEGWECLFFCTCYYEHAKIAHLRWYEGWGSSPVFSKVVSRNTLNLLSSFT